MTIEELIREAERLVKSARGNYTQGHTDAAKCDLLTAVRKIIGTLLDPAEQKVFSPDNMEW